MHLAFGVLRNDLRLIILTDDPAVAEGEAQTALDNGLYNEVCVIPLAFYAGSGILPRRDTPEPPPEKEPAPLRLNPHEGLDPTSVIGASAQGQESPSSEKAQATPDANPEGTATGDPPTGYQPGMKSSEEV